MSTLKNRYSDRVLNEMLEKISLLTEDIDRDTMNKAIETIKRLNSINLSKIPALDEARDEAVNSVSEVVAGIDNRNLTTKALDLFREKKSPLLDALTFASALRSFFTLLTNYVNALTHKAGRESVDTSLSLNALMGNFDNSERVMSRAADTLRNVVEKGFKPDGLFARANNDWRKKFVKTSNQDIVDQIMEMSPEQLAEVTKAVTTATGDVPKMGAVATNTGRTRSSETKTSSGSIDRSTETSKVIDDMVYVVKDKLGTAGASIKPSVLKQIISILDDVYGVNR